MSATSPKLLAGLPATFDAGPAWLAGLRRDAAAGLRERGFPTHKTEEWRFTPVKPVVSVAFEPAPAPARTDWSAWVNERIGAEDGTHRIVLVNGVPVALEGNPAGWEISSLGRVLAEDPGALEGDLGAIARSEYFAAMNAALFEDGLLVRVGAGKAPETPLHIVHVAAPGDGPTAAYPRVYVDCGEASAAALVETYLCADLGGEKHLTNTVTEIALQPGARLDHTRIFEGGPGYHVGKLGVRAGRDSCYTSRAVALGGAWYRLDIDVALAGPGAECALDGAYHVTGKDHVDHHTFIDHAAERCSSNEHYRGILDGAGKAVFDGTIVVRRGAQHTSAHQQNHNLLLSDDANVHTKPHLEIDTDDLTASHGATVGDLDEESMFYLRARGVGREQAEAILTYAFVREIIGEIPHDAIRHRLAAALLARLPHGETIRELA